MKIMSTENISENNLNTLLTSIHMPQEVANDILKCAKTGKNTLPGIDKLTSHILLSLENRESGDWKNLPEDIFIATMGCFSRFVNEYHVSYNNYGYDRAFWTTRQACAKLFRIGELEYEFADEDPLSIHLHIPSDAKLDSALLNDSVQSARIFMEKYYPTRSKDSISLESWLLSPALNDLLPSGSRILAFQAAFDITGYIPDTKDCLEWVFHIPGSYLDDVSLKDLPEDTTLQRNMKKFLLDGEQVGNGEGILAREFK